MSTHDDKSDLNSDLAARIRRAATYADAVAYLASSTSRYGPCDVADGIIAAAWAWAFADSMSRFEQPRVFDTFEAASEAGRVAQRLDGS